MVFPEAVCVRVAEIRKRHGKSNNLKTWIYDISNLYVGRRGRIFITDPETREKTYFSYNGSKWANPFKVGKKHYTLDTSLKLYEEYVRGSSLWDELDELEGITLGCFCLPNSRCHAKVLVELYKEKLMEEVLK